MCERKDFQIIQKRYPSQKAREAADRAVDELDDSVTLGEAMVIWNNKYVEAGGGIALTPRKKP